MISILRNLLLNEIYVFVNGFHAFFFNGFTVGTCILYNIFALQ